MPTKTQIKSVGKALRKSVDRWNIVKFRLDKAQQAYDKGQKRTRKGDHRKTQKEIQRYHKVKAEFDRAQANYVKVQKHFKEVMGRG